MSDSRHEEAERAIIGADINPGTSPASVAKYSVAILSRGKVVAAHDEAGIEDLLRLARQYRASCIAIDNISELAATRSELARWTLRLPPHCKVVQVTAAQEGMKPLHEVAREQDFVAAPKMDPPATAELCARLAARGVGLSFPAMMFPTVVTVSRGRAPGPGGMSQLRYRRRICLQVMRVALRIKERLESRQMDFDLETKPARWGYERARFVIFAGRDALHGVIRPMRGPDVHVLVEPAASMPVQTTASTGTMQKSAPRRYLIVGVDPGVVYGVAALDIGGRILSLQSRRGWNRAGVIESLSYLGRVLVVATDVHPVPLSVRKIAAMVDAVIFEPAFSLSVSEKRELARNAASHLKPTLEIEDSHQRDALASAVKAFLHYQNKFEQVESHCTGDPDLPLEEAKASVVRGSTIRDAIENAKENIVVKKVSKEETREPITPSREDLLANLERQRSKIDAQRDAIRTLEERALTGETEQLKLRQRLDELEAELERSRVSERLEVIKTREVSIMRERTKVAEADALENRVARKDLEERIQSLEDALRGLQKYELVLLKPLNALTKLSASKGVRESGIVSGDFVFVKDGSSADRNGAELIVRTGAAGVVVDNLSEEAVSAFRAAGVPVLNSHEIVLRMAGDFIFAGRAPLVESARRKREELMAEQASRNETMLDRILEEYGKERRTPFESDG